MAELKLNDGNVEDFINAVPDETKRNDSFKLLAMFGKVTGEKPKMWGSSIIGFGQYHYKSDRSSQEGDWPLTGFSPRKQNLTLYINKLSDVDLRVLEKLIRVSFLAMKKEHQ